MGNEAEDLLVVVYGLEEVALGLLGDQTVDVTKCVLFISEAVVGRDLFLGGIPGRRHLNTADAEVLIVFGGEVVACVVINAVNIECAAERDNGLVRVDFIASKVVVTNEAKTGLLDIAGERDTLAAKEDGEGVTSVVGVVNLTNL